METWVLSRYEWATERVNSVYPTPKPLKKWRAKYDPVWGYRWPQRVSKAHAYTVLMASLKAKRASLEEPTTWPKAPELINLGGKEQVQQVHEDPHPC
jgi:hypothetical protein